MASAKELISRLFTGAKNVVNTLDRDKEKPGFQVSAPKIISPLQTAPYTSAATAGFAPIRTLQNKLQQAQLAQIQAKRDFQQGRFAQNLIETKVPRINLPRLQKPAVSNPMESIGRGVYNLGVAPIAESFVNLPMTTAETIKNIGGYGIKAAQGTPYRNQDVFADVLAPAIETASNAYGIKYIPKTLPQTGTSIRAAFKQGFKETAPFGAAAGFSEGLRTGRDKTVDAQFGTALTSSVAPALISGLFGGIIKSGSAGFNKLVDDAASKLKKINPNVSEKQLKEDARGFLHNELGRYAGKKKPDKFEWYGDMREAYGLPRDGDYEKGFARIPGKEPLPWEQKGYKQPKAEAPQITKQESQEQLTKAVMAEDAPEIFKSRFNNWIGQREASKTIGAEQGFEFIGFPKTKNKEFIDAAEGVIKSNDPQVNAAVSQWKQINQTLYPEVKALAKRAGIKDLGYVENYVTHFWKEPQSVVKQKINTLAKTNRSFKGRNFLTYKEGIEAGLTPKYDNPAQILSEYVTRLNQTKANLELFEGLKKDGLLVDAVVGSKEPGFSPINAPGFPKSIKSSGEKIYEGNYYAPDSVARQINKIFQAEDTGNLARLLKKTAAISGGVQNVVLSGGIPGKSVNAFSAANIIKEITAGRVSGPIKALSIGLQSPTKALNYFKNEAKNIQELQLKGVPIRSSLNTDDLMGMQKTAGGIWDAVVSDPTFKRFMPTLQIEMYKDIKNRAFRQGMNIEQASEIAAKAVKNFYGLQDLATTTLKDRPMEDLKTTLLFAPQFRESMVNFWVNSLKSLKNPLALENINNSRFLVGSVLTLASMDYLNKQLNGHGMGENPEGKKDKLLIPLADGTTIGIPLLPSIATVPRGLFRIGEKIMSLKPKEAGAEVVRTFGSMPISTIGDIMLNEDYFGNQIYDNDENSVQRAKDIAKYIFKKNTHPWLKAGMEATQKPLYQTISQALELPIRYYQTSTIQNAPFWENYKAVKALDTKFQELKYQDPQKAVDFYNQNKADLDTLNTLKEQVKGYYQSGKDNTFLQNGGVVENDEHYAFVGQDGKFHLIDRDFSFTPPKLTGLKDLDKKLLSSATSDITAKERNVVTLFENNIISADEADSILKQLSQQKDAIKSVKSSYGGGKKLKKIAIQKLKSSARVKVGRYKPRKIKLQTVKSAKIKPLQVKPLTVNVKKYL